MCLYHMCSNNNNESHILRMEHELEAVRKENIDLQNEVNNRVLHANDLETQLRIKMSENAELVCVCLLNFIFLYHFFVV